MQEKVYQKTPEISRAETQLQEKNQKKGNWNFLGAIFIILIIGFAAILLMQDSNLPNNPQGLSPATPADQLGDDLIIQLSSLNDEAEFYSYTVDGISLRFFAVIGSDSNVHIAIDACDVCYPEKKGYYQDNSVMVCRNCGNTFIIDGIGTENLQGGCSPSYLPIRLENDQVLIKKADIKAKKYMFQ